MKTIRTFLPYAVKQEIEAAVAALRRADIERVQAEGQSEQLRLALELVRLRRQELSAVLEKSFELPDPRGDS